MNYIGLSQYTHKTLEALLNLRPDGVVFGDLLCNRKMFPYGGEELAEIMQLFKQNGISIIFQTPMYATDRVFSEVLQRILYFYEKGIVDAIIVQDIGIAATVSEKCKALTIIWGNMGYARTPVINQRTISFYQRHGVTAFVCKNPEQAEYARMIGAVGYLVYGCPKYLTINRECYCRFEENLFEDDCGRVCLEHRKMRIPAKQPIDTTLDGYVLGWQYHYDERSIQMPNTSCHGIVYADSFSEAAERYKKMTAQVISKE